MIKVKELKEQRDDLNKQLFNVKHRDEFLGKRLEFLTDTATSCLPITDMGEATVTFHTTFWPIIVSANFNASGGMSTKKGS